MRLTLLFATAAVLVLTAIGSPRAQAAAVIVYVDANAPGPTHDGDSWATAYTTLVAAQADGRVDGDGDQIWVADGTYYPGLNRENHFFLANGVALYGGFAGGETSLTDRDLQANPTILSGAIGDTNDNDNSQHVLYGYTVDATAVIDGFIIEKGFSDGTATLPGGGVYLDGNPVLRNLEIRDNWASSANGGGVYVNGGSPTFENVTFAGNSAIGGGGGAYVKTGASLTNVTFSENFAGDPGGGLAADSGSTVSVGNATFFGNIGSGDGDAIYADNNNTEVAVSNSIFFDLDAGTELGVGTGTNLSIEVENSLVDGTCAVAGITCTDVSNANPKLGGLADWGGHTRTIMLQSDSPAIDAANDAACLPLDQRGQSRVDGNFDGELVCDIGAFEYARPRVSFDSATSTGSESASERTIDVSLTNPTLGDITIDYVVNDDTAINGTDYTVPPTGSVTFPAGGALTKTVHIALINDSLDENDETFLVTIVGFIDADPGNATTHTATISDDDAPPKVRFEPGTSTAAEGRAARNMKVTLSLASSKEVTVKLAAAGGTATGGGVDYTFDPTTLTFAPGETVKTVSASVVDDYSVEDKETFVIALSDPTNATPGRPKKHTGTITNNDNGSCDGKKATIAGTAGNDILIGTDGPDVIDGKGGNDIIRGRGTDDLICGSAGDDTLIGSGGKDRILGGRGDDKINGRAGGDEVLGGPGKDSIEGGPGRDLLRGGGGDDTLKGGNGRDELRGEGGDDTLEGGPGDGDGCNGGPGTDALTAVHGCETTAGIP